MIIRILSPYYVSLSLRNLRDDVSSFCKTHATSWAPSCNGRASHIYIMTEESVTLLAMKIPNYKKVISS